MLILLCVFSALSLYLMTFILLLSGLQWYLVYIQQPNIISIVFLYMYAIRTRCHVCRRAFCTNICFVLSVLPPHTGYALKCIKLATHIIILINCITIIVYTQNGSKDDKLVATRHVQCMPQRLNKKMRQLARTSRDWVSFLNRHKRILQDSALLLPPPPTSKGNKKWYINVKYKRLLCSPSRCLHNNGLITVIMNTYLRNYQEEL